MPARLGDIGHDHDAMARARPPHLEAACHPVETAALQGTGVALARSMLVHDALADGRLVRVLPLSQDMLSSKAHVVRWPGALHRDERIRCFAAWLGERAKETRDSAGLTS